MAGAANKTDSTANTATATVITMDPWTRTRDKVAIVGFASHWALAPFDSNEWEIWSLNEFYDVAPEQLRKPLAEGRVRWFEIHGREEEYEGNPFIHSRNQANEHAAKMAALNVPVYMQQHWDDIPLSVAYPLQEMMERFSHQAGAPAYFTNSISYMIALAIHMGFAEIHIYGVDMAQGSEYAAQRPSCEYFIGWAKAAGIRVFLPPQSDLLKYSYLYGWEQPRHDALHTKLRARQDELAKRRANINAQIAQAQAHLHMLDGAIEDANYVLGVWLDTAKQR